MSVHGSINSLPLAWLGTFEHIYRYLITIPMYEKSGGSWLAALIMIQVKHRHISPWIMALCVMTSESLPVWLFNAWLDSWSTLQLNYLTSTSKCFVSENLPPHSLYPYIPEKKPYYLSSSTLLSLLSPSFQKSPVAAWEIIIPIAQGHGVSTRFGMERCRKASWSAKQGRFGADIKER